MRIICFLLVTSGLIAGCASKGVTFEQKVLEAQKNMDGKACFKTKNIDSWRVLNERFLLVYAPSIHRPWLVELAHRCGGLKPDSAVSFPGRLYERDLCGGAADEVGFGSGATGCGIKAIYPMTSKQAKSLLEKNKAVRKAAGQ